MPFDFLKRKKAPEGTDAAAAAAPAPAEEGIAFEGLTEEWRLLGRMVVRRGVNESSIVPMARWARETGVILRFIEYMVRSPASSNISSAARKSSTPLPGWPRKYL